jgi:hypothetical protein
VVGEIEPIDCDIRQELSKQLASAVIRITLLSKARVGTVSERSEASRHLNEVRREYWKHVAQHGCKDSADRLKVIGQTGPK